MRYVTFDFNGRPLPLRLTAGALFDLYDLYGVHDDILRAARAMEDTEDGWVACCELAALLAGQGELWRRRQGYDPISTPRALALVGCDRPRLRYAVLEAVRRGIARAIPTADAAGEVNLVLAARNDEAAESADRIRTGCLTVCAAQLHLAPADALLLTPGEYLDMVALLTGAGEEDANGC